MLAVVVVVVVVGNIATSEPPFLPSEEGVTGQNDL